LNLKPITINVKQQKYRINIVFSGGRMDLLSELKWRGLVKDVTSLETLVKLLQKPTTIYCGFDATANSFHIGHLVPLIYLMRFQKYGHKIIPLLGVGTGLIGDPSGRKSERQLLTLENTLLNAKGLNLQFARFLNLNDKSKTLLLNNYDWLSKIDLISFLRDYGKHFSVNYMLAKDSVATRLEAGLSYTEFSYMIIQALDFYRLYKDHDCRIQVGGSDQWGNITSGTELIRRIEGDVDVVGLTLPLITKADGTKFGKTGDGNLWLDEKLTSPYTLYQYFLNSSDQDVIHYLKVFTFLDQPTISQLETQTLAEPHLRIAQKRLAEELVELIHGKSKLDEAIQLTQLLFEGEIKKIDVNQLKLALSGVNKLETQMPINIIDALVSLNAASSKREARELIEKGTYTVNGDKVLNAELMLEKNQALNKEFIVIRKGKKNYFLVVFK
jgi:tyrosyl-tRNA synthetase